MAIVQFRVDDDLKMKASSVYEKLGIDLSSAIRMFLKRSVMINGIPFSMVLDSETYNAEAAVTAMKALNEAAKRNGNTDPENGGSLIIKHGIIVDATTKTIIYNYKKIDIYANELTLEGTFWNLIIPSGVTVKNSNYICVRNNFIIEDDGPGIPDDRKEDALRPFVRLDNARGTDTGGTGLGLSIAKTAIENHGGQLFLENSSMGGLRVHVILPIE